MALDEDYELWLRRIKAKVLERYGDIDDRRHKIVYGEDGLHMDKGQWSRKWRGKIAFNLRDIRKLRRFLGAAPAWPFVDWDAAEGLRAQEVKAAVPTPAAPPAQSVRHRPIGQK